MELFILIRYGCSKLEKGVADTEIPRALAMLYGHA
jgi:hypothetical protein